MFTGLSAPNRENTPLGFGQNCRTEQQNIQLLEPIKSAYLQGFPGT